LLRDRKIVIAVGHLIDLMLTSGQDRDLTCMLPLLENADPGARSLNLRAIPPVCRHPLVAE